MTTKKVPTQSRNWAITDFELLDWKRLTMKHEDIIRYWCMGKETCPTTGKTHYQGWIQFVNKKRAKGVKRVFESKKIHVSACLGSEIQNDAYCKKDQDWITHGEFKTQGQRTDLEHVKKLIDDEEDLKVVADDHFADYIRYHSGIEKYRALVQKEKAKEFRKVEVEVVHGPTGTGKTRYGMEQASYKIEGGEMDWWDGYEGEKTILIDEYDSQIPITKLLNILDGYTLRIPIKGSFTYARWTKVIITSNLSPEDWHSNAKSIHHEALMRRITKITEMC